MVQKSVFVAASMSMAIGVIASGAPQAAAASQTIKIVYQDYGGGHTTRDWFTSVKAQFKKTHPGVNVVLSPINASENDYYTKLDLMNQSDRTAPDIMVEDTFLVNSDASAGYLMNLNKFVQSWPDWNTQFYAPMQAAAKSSDGTVYGVPFNTDTRGIYFDKSVFKKAGLPTSWQPKTWNDILKAAQAIKSKEPGVTPLWFYSGKAMGEASTMQGFEMLLYGTKNPLYDFKTKKWVTKSQGFLDSLKFVQQIFQQHLAEALPEALTPQSGIIAVQQRFPQHKVGMLISGDWEYGNWLKTGAHPWPQWHDFVDVAKMPNQNGGGFVSLSGGWTLSISSKSKEAPLAWEFIKLACNKQNMLQVDIGDANITPRKDVAATKAYQSTGQGMLAKFSTFNAFTYFRPANSQYPSVSNQIQAAMESVMTGSVSPQQAMDQYASAVANLVGAKNTESMK